MVAKLHAACAAHPSGVASKESAVDFFNLIVIILGKRW
jgi:hypothetical protein